MKDNSGYNLLLEDENDEVDTHLLTHLRKKVSTTENIPYNKVQRLDKEVQNRKVFYDKIINNIKQSKCVHQNVGFADKNYQRKYGFFCYSCTDEEMCENCFNICHKNCDNKFKVIAELKGKNQFVKRYYCACNINLYHTPRKENPNKAEIKNQINNLNNIYSHISKVKEVFTEDQNVFLNNIILNFQNQTLLVDESLKEIKDDDNMIIFFNNSFQNLEPKEDNYTEYLNIFLVYQILINIHHFSVDFVDIKPLTSLDFQTDSYLDILWYQKLVKQKIANNQDLLNKYSPVLREQDNNRKFSFLEIDKYIKITGKITRKLCKFLCNSIKQSNNQNTNENKSLKYLLRIVCQNFDFLIKRLLVGKNGIEKIIKFIFKITIYYGQCGKILFNNLLFPVEKIHDKFYFSFFKDNTPKNDENNKDITDNKEKNFYFGFDFTLLGILYKCIKIYNLRILKDFIKRGDSTRKYMFLNSDEIIKHKCVLSFLKLISYEKKYSTLFAKKIGLELMNELFFNPFNKKIDYINSYLYLNSNVNNIDTSKIKGYVSINLELHKSINKILTEKNKNYYISQYYFKEKKNESEKSDQADGDIDERKKIEEAKEMEKLLQKLEDQINILYKMINMKAIIQQQIYFLKEVRNKNQLRIFYSIKEENKEIFVDKYIDDLLNKTISNLVYINLDYTLSLILSVIFNFILHEEKNEKEMKQIYNIVNKCINVLTLMTCNKKGLRALSIGRSLLLLSGIIFGSYEKEKEKIIYEKKRSPKYQNLYIKIYRFYSLIPINLRKINPVEANRKKIWNDPILEIIPIYKGIIMNNEIDHLKESFNLINLYDSFMQKHKETLDIRKCVEFIEDKYKSKTKYDTIQLNDNSYKMTEIYFELLDLISNNHVLFSKYKEPNKNFIHLISIDKFVNIMKNEFLSYEKKMIILKATILIITSPYKYWLNSPNCLSYKNFSEDTNAYGSILDKYLIILIEEIKKINKVVDNTEKDIFKKYYKCVFECIYYFSNFLYTTNEIGYFLFKNYYILLLFLKMKISIINKIFFEKEEKEDLLNSKVLEEETYVDKSEFNINIINFDSIPFSYEKLYEQFYAILSKYIDIQNPLYTYFFSTQKNYMSFSSIELRFEKLFENYFPENANSIRIKNNNLDFIRKLNKWINYTKEQINDTNNYVIQFIFQSENQQKLNFHYDLEDNLPCMIFSLLNINIEMASSMILRISSKVIESLKIKNFYAEAEDENSNSPKFLESIMKNLINKLYTYITAHLSVVKLYSNTKIENEFCKKSLILIKLMQNMLENFNSTFMFYFFIKKFNLNLEIDDFDKDIDYGYYDLLTNNDINIYNYFDISIPTKEVLSLSSRDLIEKQKYIRSPPINNAIGTFTNYNNYFGFGLSILKNNDSKPKSIFELFLPLLELSTDILFGKQPIKIRKTTKTPESNFYVLYSAIIDFLIECSSNFSLCTVKIINDSIFDYFIDFKDQKSQISMFWILPFKKKSMDNDFLNLDVFLKIRLLDLICNLLTSGKFPYYESINLLKECFPKFNDNAVGIEIFKIILFYFQDIIEKMIKNKTISYRKIIKIKNLSNPKKNYEDFEALFLEVESLRESLEFELITKLYNLINILQFDYGDNCVKKHFKELSKSGQYDKGEFTINSPIAYIIYKLLKKVCLVIEFYFKVSKKCIDNVNQIKIPAEYLLKKEIKEENEEKKEKKEKEEKEKEKEKEKGKLEESSICEYLLILNYFIYCSSFGNENEGKDEDKEEEKISQETIDQNIKEFDDNNLKLIDSSELNQVAESGKKYVYFIRPPQTFYFLPQQMDELIKEMDHSSHENKITSLMGEIDYNCLYMNFRAHNKKKGKVNSYEKIEVINNIFILILNILFLIHYYKSYTLSDEEYGISIWKETSNIRVFYILILVCVHTFFCFSILLTFIRNDLIYSLSRIAYDNSENYFVINYSADKKEKDTRSEMTENEINRKNIIEDYLYHQKTELSNFQLIQRIFDDLSCGKLIALGFWIFIKPNKEISFILWSMICDILYLYTNLPIFIVIPLLFVAHYITTVQDILKGLKTKWKTILFVFYFDILIIFILMWNAFLFFPDHFSSDVKNEEGQIIEGGEPFCNSSFQCFMFFISNGLYSSGTSDMIGEISYKRSFYFYLAMFFYNFVGFIIIGIILENIFTGLIADAFSEHRQKTEEKNDSLENQCFICDILRENYQNKGGNFESHRKNVHNTIHYFYFLFYLCTKNPEDFSMIEKSIWDLIQVHDITWFPHQIEEEGEGD